MSPEGSGPRADGKPSAEAAGCPQGRMCSASSLQNSGPGLVPQGMRTLLHWAGRRLALRPRGRQRGGEPRFRQRGAVRDGSGWQDPAQPPGLVTSTPLGRLMETFWGWQGGQTCQVGAHAWFREPCGDLGAASRAPLDRGIGGWAHPGTSVPGDPPISRGFGDLRPGRELVTPKTGILSALWAGGAE